MSWYEEQPIWALQILLFLTAIIGLGVWWGKSNKTPNLINHSIQNYVGKTAK